MGQGPTLIDLRAASPRNMALGRVQIASDRRRSAAGGKLSLNQLREFSRELATMPELAEPSECANVSERYMFLDALQFLARSNPAEAAQVWSGISNHPMAPPWVYYFLPIPYEKTMKSGNHWHDGFLAAVRQPTYALRHAAFVTCEQTATDLAQHSHFGPLSPQWALGLFMPALNRIEQRWETSRAELRLTRYGRRHWPGRSIVQISDVYPPTLSDLSPAFLSELPLDNFTDRPLIYSRTDHGYTLYSAGPNMLDDGGSTAAGDDVVASLK